MGGLVRAIGVGIATLVAQATFGAELSTAPNGAVAPGVSAIEQMATIPTGDIKVVESRGELLFMSTNGRFIIKGGTLYDAWNRKALRTITDVRSSADRVDLKAMQIDVSELRPLSFGKGPKRVTLFVDPKCKWCAQVMARIRDTRGLADRYTFDLLPIPVLGSESERLVRQLGCAQDRSSARDALMQENYATPLVQRETCDLAPLQKTFVLAHLLGVNGVPFLIAPDGRIQRGVPADLVTWLENRGPAPALGKAGP